MPIRYIIPPDLVAGGVLPPFFLPLLNYPDVAIGGVSPSLLPLPVILIVLNSILWPKHRLPTVPMIHSITHSIHRPGGHAPRPGTPCIHPIA